MSKAIKWIVALVVLIVILWIAFWVYAQMQLKQVVQTKISAINSTGLEHISYDRITTSSSPFVISVKLINPSLTKPPVGGVPPVQISTAYLGASLSIFHPLTLHQNIAPRIDIQAGQNAGMMTFGAINSTNILRPSVWWGDVSNPISQSDSLISNMQVSASNGSLSLVSIGTLKVHEELGPDITTATQKAALVTLSIDNLQVAPAFTQMLHLPFGGEVKHLDTSFTIFGPFDVAALEKEIDAMPADQRSKAGVSLIQNWAAAGGHLLANLNLNIGTSALATNLILGFDKQAQPTGTTSINATHLDQFTAALVASYPNMQDKITQAQAALAPYISTTPQDGQVLAMQTVFGQKGITINGKQTSTTPVTINWEALKNPPQPMPALAPGDESGAAAPSPTTQP